MFIQIFMFVCDMKANTNSLSRTFAHMQYTKTVYLLCVLNNGLNSKVSLFVRNSTFKYLLTLKTKHGT